MDDLPIKTQILTESQERLYVRRAQAGNLAARDRLVESNMRLVIALAKPYSSRGIPFQDLLQEGALGLMRAVDKFDPRRGYRFTTYAGLWVRQALSRAVDNKSRDIRLPSHVHEYVRKINKAKMEYAQSVGEEPSREDLAKWLGWEPKKLQQVLSHLRETVSLEEPVGDTTLGSLLEDTATTPEAALMLTAASCDVAALLSSLNMAEKTVLTMRLNEDKDIHKAAGMSRERVKVLESSAIRKLADAARTALLITCDAALLP